MSGGKRATRGTPQGGVVSPLLANIYMHRHIKAFRRYGLDQQYGAKLLTYADDAVTRSTLQLSRLGRLSYGRF
jgi:RNA-directed DNA polymerase